MKLLNLDELAITTRAVVLGGVEYPLKDQTLAQAISNIERAEAAEGKGSSELETLKEMHLIARQMLPTAPDDVIGGMTVPQVLALIEWVSAADAQGGSEEVKAAMAPGQKKD